MSTPNQDMPAHLAPEGVSTPQAQCSRVLIAVDESQVSQKVIPHGLAVARALGAETSLVRVLETREPNVGLVDPVEWHLLRQRACRYIESLARRQPGRLSTQVSEGRPSDQICRWAREHQASIIVLGAQGENGKSGQGLGQTARRIVEDAPNSILLVPTTADDKDPVHYQSIMVPLDGSSRAESALPLALRIAEAEDAEVVLVHAVPQPELTEIGPLEQEDLELKRRVEERNERVARDYLRRIRARFLDKGIATKIVLLRDNDVRHSLLQAISEQDASIIVMASHGHSKHIDLPMGSIAAHLISQVRVPILLTRNHALTANMGGVANNGPFVTRVRRTSRVAA